MEVFQLLMQQWEKPFTYHKHARLVQVQITHSLLGCDVLYYSANVEFIGDWCPWTSFHMGAKSKNSLLMVTKIIIINRCIRFDDKRIVSGAYDG